ncbi:MAG: tRNA (guanosine(37)-N1)-methyltransferase TrmD [Lentisphaerae bacterium]|nr:tRNA (guanosine(37)-N1)-methyltransferase TrmD [Lentisphaerota bacterium]
MSLKFDIITLFPEIFFGPLGGSIVGRAIEKGIVEVNAVNLRDYTHDKRGTVDDKPYGGGAGMLMKVEPLFEAVEDLRKENTLVLMTSPSGEPFNQKMAHELAAKEHIMIICGHYEGVDERVREALVDREVSIGDYVLTSGNLPAMVMVDAVTRLLPGALGSPESEVDESFENGLLEYPQYTRPPVFRGMAVPEVLLSGNHAEIAKWRREQSEQRTAGRRPDLLNKKIEDLT